MRSVWTATHETKKPLPVELEIDEFTKEDLESIFNVQPTEEQLETYKNNHLCDWWII